MGTIRPAGRVVEQQWRRFFAITLITLSTKELNSQG